MGVETNRAISYLIEFLAWQRSARLTTALVPVRAGLVRSGSRNVDVLGLFVAQRRELNSERIQMKAGNLQHSTKKSTEMKTQEEHARSFPRDRGSQQRRLLNDAPYLLVELLRQDVNVAACKLAGLALFPQLELRESLVRKRVGHDERRVTRRAAQVQKTPFGKDYHTMAIFEDELVHLSAPGLLSVRADGLRSDPHLRLDVDALGGALQALHVNLVVKVPDVAHDGVVLHLLHVRSKDDPLVSRGRDEDVRLAQHGLEPHDAEAFHGGLQRADRVDLGDVHNGPRSLQGLGAPFAHVAEAAHHRALAGEHDVRSPHDAVRQRMLASVEVVELGLGDRVVDVDRGEEQLLLLLHAIQAVDARGRLLGDAHAASSHLVPALRILLELAGNDAEHDLELGIVRAVRIRHHAVLLVVHLSLVALVDQKREVSAVVHDQIRAVALAVVLGPGARLQGALPVLRKRLSLPGEDRRAAVAGDRSRGVVLGGEDVARAPADVRAHRRQRLDQDGGLDRHVQRAGDPGASKGLGAELVAARHQTGHFLLGKLDLLAPELGEGNVRHVVVQRIAHGRQLLSRRDRAGGHQCFVLLRGAHVFAQLQRLDDAEGHLLQVQGVEVEAWHARLDHPSRRWRDPSAAPSKDCQGPFQLSRNRGSLTCRCAFPTRRRRL
eukprot:scaffold28_cov312-Pinguiococcus_pyrenoidosus.AAC.9